MYRFGISEPEYLHTDANKLNCFLLDQGMLFLIEHNNLYHKLMFFYIKFCLPEF